MEAANMQTDLSAPDDIALADRMNQGQVRIKQELKKLIVGQDEVLQQVLYTLFVGGNSLIIGVPGLAKTLLIHTLARVVDLKFARIQFTPDLMPADITGTEILQDAIRHRTGASSRSLRGPVFANMVLADEINRTPPKTQSALLEAMQEHRVTIQGRTYTLEEPFYVFATQNPIELEGTYPLPEAQLDRFMFHIVINHPPEDEEFEVVRTTTAVLDPQFERTVNGEDLIAFKRLVRRVPVAEPVMRYALSLVRASRPKGGTASDLVKKWVSFGASVRAAQYLVLAAKARALTSGRYHVTFEDIRALAHPVLRHRVLIQLPRPVGRHELRHDRRQAARVGAGAAVGDVGMQLGGVIPGAQFVDPAVLARIGNLELVARSVVDGVINGLHKSPFFGTSVDFAEHRGYVAGDDIRRVDWRVFARTDKFYVKEFEADSNSNFVVLLDVSASMAYGPKNLQARLRPHPGRLPHVSRASPARPRRSRDVRPRDPRSRAAVGQAPRRGAAHARSGAGDAPGSAHGAVAPPGRALRPPRRHRADLGPLRRARGDLRRAGPDALPRQRRRRVPRARPDRARVPVHRPVGVRRPRDR